MKNKIIIAPMLTYENQVSIFGEVTQMGELFYLSLKLRMKIEDEKVYYVYFTYDVDGLSEEESEDDLIDILEEIFSEKDYMGQPIVILTEAKHMNAVVSCLDAVASESMPIMQSKIIEAPCPDLDTVLPKHLYVIPHEVFDEDVDNHSACELMGFTHLLNGNLAVLSQTLYDLGEEAEEDLKSKGVSFTDTFSRN